MAESPICWPNRRILSRRWPPVIPSSFFRIWGFHGIRSGTIASSSVGDTVGKEVILHSGVTPFRRTAFRTFERTWARGGYWGLLVLPPSDLPATAEESIYVAAASQLERLENWGVALQAYRSALTRWPDNLPAVVGIGVCLYRMGDLASAETHLRAAGKRFPQEGVVFNNLAQVLLEQGRRGEALQAATYALECGGPLKSHFEETLEEIHNYKPDAIDNPNEK